MGIRNPNVVNLRKTQNCPIWERIAAPACGWLAMTGFFHSLRVSPFLDKFIIPHRGFPVKKNTDHHMATGIFSSKGRGSYPSSRKLSRVKR